jgi:predicted transcriptional regulator
MQQGSEAPITGWDFLTNHAHVLVCVAHDPGIRLRDIAAAVGITERTERAAHRILSELVEGGYVVRERQGRRNRYQVKPELPLRHPLVQGREVGDLLEVLLGSGLDSSLGFPCWWTATRSPTARSASSSTSTTST